jgi:hypothetical protein
MNKFYWLGLLTLIALPVAAENVSSVSFNPSRLGNYDYLKVSGPAKFPGGLRTPVLEVNTPGTLTVQNNTTSAIFNVESISGDNTGTEFHFPNAIVHGGNAITGTFSYSAASKSAPSVTPVNLYISGGKLDFSSNSNIDSYLNALQVNHNLYQYAQTLHATNVEVRMPEDDGMSDDPVTLINAALEDNVSTSGFTLGTTDILRPTQVKYKENDSSSSFYSSVDLTNNNCQLRWVKRKLSNQDKYAYVLALDNCDVTCTPRSEDVTITRNCSSSDVLGGIQLSSTSSGWYGTASTIVRYIVTCEQNGGQYQATEPTMVYLKADGSTTENASEANWDKSGCYSYQWTPVAGSREYLDQPHWHEWACVGNHDNECDDIAPHTGMNWLNWGYWSVGGDSGPGTCTASRVGETVTQWTPCNYSAGFDSVEKWHKQINQTAWCHKYNCYLTKERWKCSRETYQN